MRAQMPPPAEAGSLPQRLGVAKPPAAAGQLEVSGKRRNAQMRAQILPPAEAGSLPQRLGGAKPPAAAGQLKVSGE